MSSGVYVGIDADTVGLAYCAVRQGAVLRSGYFRRANRAGAVMGTYDAAVGEFMTWCARMDAVVYVERPFLRPPAKVVSEDGATVALKERGSVDGFASMWAVVGELRHAGRVAGVVVHDILGTTWQRKVLGFSGCREALKSASVKLAVSVLGVGISDHEADAYGLALWAQKHSGEERRVNGAGQLALDGMERAPRRCGV